MMSFYQKYMWMLNVLQTRCYRRRKDLVELQCKLGCGQCLVLILEGVA